MGEWLSYLRFRRFGLFVWAICLGILLLTAYLGGQDMALFAYGAGMVSFLFFLVLAADGIHFCRRLRLLRDMEAHLDAIPGSLPAFHNALEEAYGTLLSALGQQSDERRLELERSQADSLAYYTLWVHQIKTPIAAMRLVLQKSNCPEAGVLQQELFKIERYADLALQYIKLQDMAADLVISRCDLNDLVHESVKKYGLLFIYAGLGVDIQPLDRDVVSDPKWLRFILEQVISNAAKYTRQGGLRVYMDGGRLALADTGIGIRAEDLPRIFEKGYTGYNGRLDGRASGIGLFMAKQAADALGIALEVRSAPGRGTTVYLSFPDGDTFRFM